MRVAVALGFLLISFSLFGQQKHSFKKEIQFAQYLVNKKQHEDAVFLLQKLDIDNLAPFQVDSVNYYLGKAYYNLQDLTNSSFYLSKIKTPTLPFYLESRFFDAYNNMFLGDYKDSKSIFNSLHPEEDMMSALLNYQNAGLALLERRVNDFDSLAGSFKYNYFQFSQQEKELLEVRERLGKHKTKSPALAGIFSAIIPGAGKIYAGKPGQGIASLITSSIFGLQAIEGYRRDGPSSFRFIAFSTIFSLFYVGNIWGSVFTVKAVNNEFNEAVDHKILFDLHIPLRTIFH